MSQRKSNGRKWWVAAFRFFDGIPNHVHSKRPKLFDNVEVIVLLYYGHETKWKLFRFHPSANQRSSINSNLRLQLLGNFYICQNEPRVNGSWRFPNSTIYVMWCGVSQFNSGCLSTTDASSTMTTTYFLTVNWGHDNNYKEWCNFHAKVMTRMIIFIRLLCKRQHVEKAEGMKFEYKYCYWWTSTTGELNVPLIKNFK